MTEAERTYTLASIAYGSKPSGERGSGLETADELELLAPEGNFAISWLREGKNDLPMPPLASFDDSWRLLLHILPALIALGRDAQPAAVMAALDGLGFQPSEAHLHGQRVHQLEADRVLFDDLRHRRPEWFEGIKLVEGERPE